MRSLLIVALALVLSGTLNAQELRLSTEQQKDYRVAVGEMVEILYEAPPGTDKSGPVVIHEVSHLERYLKGIYSRLHDYRLQGFSRDLPLELQRSLISDFVLVSQMVGKVHSPNLEKTQIQAAVVQVSTWLKELKPQADKKQKEAIADHEMNLSTIISQLESDKEVSERFQWSLLEAFSWASGSMKSIKVPTKTLTTAKSTEDSLEDRIRAGAREFNKKARGW